MRARLLVPAALAAAVALAFPSSAASKTPVMDGVKTKELSFTDIGAMQTHDDESVTGLVGIDSDTYTCAMPRCATHDFVYAPARGVVGDVYVESSWSTAVADVDLYVAKVGADGKATELKYCAGAGGTKERVFLPAKDLVTGTTYRVIVDFFRTNNESVTTKVTMPGTNGIPTTLEPLYEDDHEIFDCAL